MENIFLFDMVDATKGLQYALFYGLFFGFLFTLLRYMILGVIERSEA